MIRAPRHLWLLALGGLAFAGACGGFNNGPFEAGTVRGRVVGAEASVALVSILGQPDLKANVSEDGSFELTNVPASDVELFVVASSTLAAREKVVAQAARITDVGDIVAPKGGFVDVFVVDDDGDSYLGVFVEVFGTTYVGLRADPSTKRVRVGPLPEGCYKLVITTPNHDTVLEDLCVAPEQEIPFVLNLDDDDPPEVEDGGSDDDGGA